MVQTDATGITVLDSDAPGGSRLGQMWCFLGDGGRLCVFKFAEDGKGENGPWKYLEGRTPKGPQDVDHACLEAA